MCVPELVQMWIHSVYEPDLGLGTWCVVGQRENKHVAQTNPESFYVLHE